MAILIKKIKATTLVESLVSSAIILIVFVFSSLSLNSLFSGSVRSDDSQLQNRIQELSYLYNNDKLSLPYDEETDQWELILLNKEDVVIIEGENKRSSESFIITISP